MKKIPEGFEVVGCKHQWGVSAMTAYRWCGFLQWLRIPHPYYLMLQFPIRFDGLVLAPKGQL